MTVLVACESIRGLWEQELLVSVALICIEIPSLRI